MSTDDHISTQHRHHRRQGDQRRHTDTIVRIFQSVDKLSERSSLLVSSLRSTHLWKNAVHQGCLIDQLPVGVEEFEKRLSNGDDVIGEEVDEQRNEVFPVGLARYPRGVRLVLRNENSRQKFQARRGTEEHERSEETTNEQFIERVRRQCVEIRGKRPEKVWKRSVDCHSLHFLLQIDLIHGRQTIEQLRGFDVIDPETIAVEKRASNFVSGIYWNNCVFNSRNQLGRDGGSSLVNSVCRSKKRLFIVSNPTEERLEE